MNYYTFFYLIIIFFIIFKNDLFSKIIDFNIKNDTKKFLNNTLKSINIKKLTIICIAIYLIYKIKFIYKILILILSVIIYFNYTGINFILNQLLNVYNNNFLINKFLII